MLEDPTPVGLRTPGPAGRRSTWVVSGLVLLALVGALVVYKTGGSLATIANVERSHTLQARPEAVPAAALPSGIRPLVRSLNYLAVVWPALVFGVLIGATVRALVPSSWLSGWLGGSFVRSQLLGGLAGAPLMLCSCCVAPIFAAVHERTQRAGPAGALLLAAPSLNPAAMALTFMLFASAVAITRAAMALVLVFGVSALAARFSRSSGPGPEPCPLESAPQAGPAAALRAFGRESLGLARTTLPLIIAGIVLSSLILDFVPLESLRTGAGEVAAVLLVALVSVPLALPTFAEIPLALGLLAAGAPTGAAVALLIAGPAINLPSLLTLRRRTNASYAIALAVGTFVVAVAGGLLL